MQILHRLFNRLRMRYSPSYRAKVYTRLNRLPFEFRVSEGTMAGHYQTQRALLQLQLIKAGYMRPEDLELP